MIRVCIAWVLIAALALLNPGSSRAQSCDIYERFDGEYLPGTISS